MAPVAWTRDMDRAPRGRPPRRTAIAVPAVARLVLAARTGNLGAVIPPGYAAMTVLQDVPTLIVQPAFAAALAHLADDHDRFVDDIIRLTEIPAPPFQEARRAEALRAAFIDLGLHDVQIDAEGNVTGLRPGQGAGGGLIAVAAHLDTVFPEGTDVTVRREGTKLFAPGVGDDTRGLAALLAFVRALEAGGVRTAADLLFVADVGEEGKGDLRGVRHLFTRGPYAGRIDAFFTIDGLDTADLNTGAVGSRRLRATFRGPGGHAMLAFGTVNPAHALAAVVTGLARIAVPAVPLTTYCASLIGGGHAINAIPEAVWLELDLRSEDPGALSALEAQVRGLIDAAVADETARGQGEVRAEFEVLGDRPAGATDPEAAIVIASLAAIRAFGFTPRTGPSSTDANIPMSLGIPAVKFSSGGTGGRAHSLDEWIDVAPDLSVRGLAAALAAIVATAGLVTA